MSVRMVTRCTMTTKVMMCQFFRFSFDSGPVWIREGPNGSVHLIEPHIRERRSRLNFLGVRHVYVLRTAEIFCRYDVRPVHLP